MISNRRRQGQGMTEYIVLVGLIGILLIAAVTRFKNQIQYTIEGTAGTVDDMNLGSSNPNLDAGDGDTPTGPPLRPTGRRTPAGDAIFADPDGNEFTKRSDGTPVPYNGG